MCRHLLKPYSFLFYLFSFVLGFFIGVSYAGFIEAGKDQMLAGGAIVLGYGVIGAMLGLIVSIFSIKHLNSKTTIRLNIIFTVLIITFMIYYKVNFDRRQKARTQENLGFLKPIFPDENITYSG